MNTPFFITGQIRSRSAWLANLFTTDTTLCFHDPNDSITELMGQYPHYRVGISSSFLVTQFRLLADKYPDAPWLYVDRNLVEAKLSLRKFTGGKLFGKDVDRILDAHAMFAEAVKSHAKTLVVPFDDIEQHLRDAWVHLLGGTFPATRARILSEFRIEQRLGVVLNRLMKGSECPQLG